jgi:type I restriction enzyme S subunit
VTLPEGWVEALVGDLVEPIETADPSTEPDRAFRYVDIGSIDNQRQSIEAPKEVLGREAPSRARRRIRTGDVLFSTVRPNLKNIALVPEHLDGEFTSTGICVLRAKDGIQPGYLFRRVTSQDFIDAMTRASDGTMYPAIADRDVFTGEIALPPTAEQRRIVAKLEALTARLARARAELNRVLTLSDRLRGPTIRAALQELFALHGDVSAGDLFSWASGKFLPKKAQNGGDFPVYGGNGVNGWHNHPNVEMPTLIVGRVGAQCGNIHITGGAAWVTDNAIYARAISPSVDLRFALHVFDDAKLIQQAAGTGQPYVNQAALSAVRFPKVDLETQRTLSERFASALARADRLEAEAARARALLDRLESAILAKAFRGELVPQDPNDEPASVLLDRIRAQRAAAPKAKRGRAARASA